MKRYTADQKAVAVALADKIGVPEASKQLRIFARTIWLWRRHARKAESGRVEHMNQVRP